MWTSDNPDRWIVGGVVRLILIGLVLLVVIGGCTYWWAPWKGEIEERNQTVGSGTYRIASYEWYFDQCSAIQTHEQIYGNYKTELGSDPAPSPDQAVRLKAGMTAEANTWAALVNEYNANAAKERTKAQFKDDGLPDNINPSNLNDGVTTTCTS